MGVLNRLIGKIRELFYNIYCRYSFNKVYGPSPHKLNNSCFYVATLIKNDESFIEEFIAHYTKLKAEHIFIIDNGSTDNSLSIAKKHSNVSIYRNTLLFSKHQSRIRRIFLQKYMRGNWVVFTDVDEHFYHPFCEKYGMMDILSYLNKNKYTAVAACMLDMLPDESSGLDDSDIHKYRLYHEESIETLPYPTHQYVCRSNKLSESSLLFVGGVRKLLNPAGSYYLIKHPLMFIDDNIVPFTHPHFCDKAVLADFNAVLLHYKFFGDFKRRIASSLNCDSRSDVWIEENRSISKLNLTDIIKHIPGLKVLDVSDFFHKSELFSCPVRLESYLKARSREH